MSRHTASPFACPPRWSQVGAFCLLTFGLTWTWWWLRLSPHFQIGQSIDRSALGPLDVQVGMFGPLLAAVILRLLNREGFRNSLGLKRPWRIYALAYLAPTMLGMAALAFNHATGLGRFEWAGEGPLQLLLTLAFVTPLAALTALGEEYGWRGYLLPRLIASGSTRASLLVGLIWGLWHLPLLLAGLTYPEQPFVLGAGVFIFCVILLSFLFTGFHHLSSGSVMVAALVHGSLNALSELASPLHIPAGSPLVVNPFGLTTALLVFLAVLAAARFIRRANPIQPLEKAAP